MKIQELYSNDPSRWTRGANARDINGEMVDVDSNSATCLCLLGASIKCYGWSRWSAIYDKIVDKVGCRVSAWNDAPERTFEDVKALVEELDI